MRRIMGNGDRRHIGMPYMSQEMSDILGLFEKETNDPALVQSVYFGPTVLTHVKRLLEAGGTIITDTHLIANDIDHSLLGKNGTAVKCFIEDEQVLHIAEKRKVTRAEVAVDYGLALPGLKLMVIGSAPAAIGRLLTLRQREPMSDVCVIAAPTGFASVVQIKEKLLDSELASIVVRGKKGGIGVTTALLNAILTEIKLNNLQVSR